MMTALLAVSAHATTFDGRCAVRFFAESTLHDFEGQAVCQPLTLPGTEAPPGTLVIRQPVVSVLVQTMDTDNSGRDEKMRAMFDSDRFPEIQGLFDDLAPELFLQQLQEAGDQPVVLTFNMKIREIAHPVQATIHDVAITPEQVSFVMDFPLSLSQFELHPPSVLGMIRVADEVRVEVRPILHRQGHPPKQE